MALWVANAADQVALRNAIVHPAALVLSMTRLPSTIPGDEELQQAVMASAVPGTLTAHLLAPQAGVREAAAWCVVNLSSSDTDTQPLQVRPTLQQRECVAF